MQFASNLYRYRGDMKQAVNQVFEFFRKHKYGRLSLALLLLGLVFIGAIFIRAGTEEKPIALSEVAASITDGQVIRIEELQGAIPWSSTTRMGPRIQRDETQPLPSWSKCNFSA